MTFDVKDVTVANRPFQAFGGALKMWRSGKREVLMVGPAGTGKSRAIIQRLHFIAHKYPDTRIIMCRKTRASLTQTAIVTYEKKVLPEGWLGSLIHWNTVEQQYEYPNGSIIAVGGLDKPTKVLSSEWDVIYVMEAIELTEEDWETLVIRARNAITPYQMLLADTNPGAETHWLKRRCDTGKVYSIQSRHEDNPAITPAYIEALKSLTGVRYKRYYLGIWATADGMVYEEDYDASIHLIDRFDVPTSWPRYWVIDWGFRNPFVWQAWAESPDGEMYRYREIYHTGLLVENVSQLIMRITANEPRPVAVVCDHDAEDRATFESHTGLSTIGANKAVSIGIQTVQGRLRIQKNNRAGIYLMRDSIAQEIGIDRSLEEKSLPVNTEGEFESYVWDTNNGKVTKEEPLKKYDHGMDCLRYLCMYIDDPAVIEPLNTELSDAISNYQGY
jgi:PBSX family phage terminase large subunit